MAKLKDIVRFMLFVRREGECWIWTGSTSGDGRGGGYGRFSYCGVTVAAHRWAYIHIGGKKIRKGLQLDHDCRRRLCVRPKHLVPCTNRVNNRRKPKRGKR